MKPYQYFQSYQKDQTVNLQFDRSLIYRLIRYLIPFRHWLLLALVLMIVAKTIEAIVPIWIGNTTQIILSKDKTFNIAFQEVFWSCMVIIGWIIFGYFLEVINILIKSWVGQKALYNLRTETYAHIQKLPVAFYDHYAVGRLMTRTIHDVDQVSQMFSEGVVPILGNIVLFFGILVGIFFLDWKVGLSICTIIPFVWWMTHRFRTQQRRCYELIRAIVSAMNAFVQENLMGMSTIRHFGLQRQEKKKFDELNIDHCQANIESVRCFSFFIAAMDLLQSMTLILIFATLLIFSHGQTGFHAGLFFTYSIYVLMFFRPLGDLAERYNVLQSAMAAAGRIFEILDQREEVSVLATHQLKGEIETIEFQDVWFAYEKENWVLKGISFKVKKGESLALVGMTGAGKTSITNLLLRLYEFQKGFIIINGKDIREYSLSEVRRRFSVILQDPVIFSGTIADNISLYDPTITLKEIEASIDYVNLRPIVDRFPEKRNHVIKGRGQDLSLGEMQLISLARAVAHRRDVIIMDEATANIDIQGERIIQEALKRVLKDKTALVIAHRLSTLEYVNRIIVLHQGTIAEIGTHEELLKNRGIYEKLYRRRCSATTLSIKA